MRVYVSHPGVCQLYEIGEDEHTGSLYLVMELLEGESLDQRLAKGLIPLCQAVQITTMILQALEALHAANIVHRDLKPKNEFLTMHGQVHLDAKERPA